MQQSFSELLRSYIDRLGLPVGRVASQAGIPKQTLYNWLRGCKPRWHDGLPTELEKLSRALGLNAGENDAMLMAAGATCAVDTPHFEGSQTELYRMPEPWFRAGSHPAQYHLGVDPECSCGDLPAAVLRSRSPVAHGFGTLMQNCPPDKFLGERVCFSAMARTEGIAGSAGLWFRVDGPQRGHSLSFDNMHDRRLSGDSDWARYSIVLDVPRSASNMAFGVLLTGIGAIWIADAHFEVTDLNTPSTNMTEVSDRPREPWNLDFTQ